MSERNKPTKKQDQKKWREKNTKKIKIKQKNKRQTTKHTKKIKKKN